MRPAAWGIEGLNPGSVAVTSLRSGREARVASGVVETLARPYRSGHSLTALRLFRSLGAVVLAARYVYSLASVGFALAGKSV